MQFAIRGRQVDFELQPVILALIILGWAIYYYFSTVSKPEGGERAVLFIKPLTIMIVVCFIFVVLRAVRIESKKSAPEISQEEASVKDKGFLDHRRIFFTSSLAVYAAGLTFLGYLLPSILFVFIVCYYLGVRSPWILIGLTVGLSGFMSMVFKILLKVPIPILPSW